MLHAAARAGVDWRLVVLAACACARNALRHVPPGEARPLRAIETAEAWTRGEATAEQVSAASFYAAQAASDANANANANAAYAAYAAFYASLASTKANADYSFDCVAYAAFHAAAASTAGRSPQASQRDALREMTALVRSIIPTLNVLRGARAKRPQTP